MKKIFLLITLAGTLFLLHACTATGYVASEPSYVEYSRPNRPSEQHIWIDGDWVWIRKSNVYVRKPGHWQKPRNGSVYIAGSWQSNSNGLYWQSGRWQR